MRTCYNLNTLVMFGLFIISSLAFFQKFVSYMPFDSRTFAPRLPIVTDKTIIIEHMPMATEHFKFKGNFWIHLTN